MAWALRTLYTGLFHLALPFILWRLWRRGKQAPRYRQRVGERFGFFKGNPAPGGIWIHTVSVGETLAAAPLIKSLQQQYPERSITVTTTTPTGSERALQLFGDSVFHVYLPYDLPWCLTRFFRRIQPAIGLIMETELWPNVLAIAHNRGIPTVLLNARLSAKSARGYQRFGGLSREMLSNLSGVAVQNATDGQRFIELGLDAEKLAVSGNIKFDIDINAAQRALAEQLKVSWRTAQHPIWIAASTHPGEDEILLEAHRQLLTQHPNQRLLLIPRHPERFAAVTEQATNAGFKVGLRRQPDSINDATQVIIGDTMGEMLALMGTARIAFIGGSLIPHGGHNMLEACIWQLPILNGPYFHNFQEIGDQLVDAGAMVLASDAAQLAAELGELIDSPKQAQIMGTAGLHFLQQHRGALNRISAIIATHLQQ